MNRRMQSSVGIALAGLLAEGCSCVAQYGYNPYTGTSAAHEAYNPYTGANATVSACPQSLYRRYRCRVFLPQSLHRHEFAGRVAIQSHDGQRRARAERLQPVHRRP